MSVEYELTFDSGLGPVTWRKTAEELLTPNGSSDTLLDFMLREATARGDQIALKPCQERDLATVCHDVVGGLVEIANRGGLSATDMLSLGTATGVVAVLGERFRGANDEPNVRFPECAECGAPPGQAHDPACTVRQP